MTDKPAQTKAVLSVLGKDRKGIVARVATTLANCEVNIDDISQTLLDELFSMTMLVTLSEDLVSFEAVQAQLATDAEALGVQITLQRQDVFDFMYKV
ncbi:MAG: ACT domain-containing protein [Coriobacteriales bacterium]|jgi:ACT domain-containing protein|nr:ACT domain-containing protein [Coriobacteriales bacterium]